MTPETDTGADTGTEPDPDAETPGDDGTYFPTEEWLEAYGRVLDESEAFSEFGAGWGVDFDGDVCYVVEDLPIGETTLGDLPEGILAELPDHVREGVGDVPLESAPETFGAIKEGLPASTVEKLDQLESYVHDGAVYAHIGLEDGRCTGVEVLEDPEDADVEFVLRGEYGTWRSIVDGRPSAAALLSGELDFEGDAFRRVRYAAMFQLLGELAAEVETTHLFPGEPSPTPMLDTAVKGPVQVQRETHRQLKRAFDLF